MHDFKGNRIEIGDTIIACVSHGRNSGASLVECVVEGFTPTMVKAKIPSYTGHVGLFTQQRISPNKVFVIKKVS